MKMKPYDELTRKGQLRRLRRLAEQALEDYGLGGAKLTFQHYEGNAIFRVDVDGPVQDECGIYVPNRYNMRILSMNNPEMTASELVWLAALKGGGFPVPEPVETVDGSYLKTVTTPGVPHGRVVSLMRWVDGRKLTKRGIRQQHIRAWGALMGRLHKFAAGWTPPEGFNRFVWDWDGILGNAVLRTPVDELVDLMPEKFRVPFVTISNRTREAMDALGKGSDAFGMIHTDMYLENVLFKGGEPRAIDFEDCGFGYWLYDIGIVLSDWLWDEAYPWVRESFLEAYLEVHSLPEEQLKYLDLFTAGRFADFTLWGTAFIKGDPGRKAEHTAWRDESGDQLVRFFEEMS
jgi:Ser/Thr protein kinase RdoA (MazF antagonist)